ncbi:hypothetical protein PAEAM_56590 [Paenibacillus sp. GM1FR]|nr:hypothetical protein PAEAM_56590 [Paenibacillus sp. GM1FR]
MYETLLAAQRRGFIVEDIEIYHYPITVNRYSDEQREGCFIRKERKIKNEIRSKIF